MDRKPHGRTPSRRTPALSPGQQIKVDLGAVAPFALPPDMTASLIKAVSRRPEDVDVDLSENARSIAECAVAIRLAQGKPHDVIRREVIEVTKEAIGGAMEDLGRGEWELERYIAVVQRTIEAELGRAA